ncbi:MAG: hypothetical protein GX224_04655 [Thermoplasmatales archaeon]|nr:hypothetical protein [Thermoplasmatales archaeon]
MRLCRKAAVGMPVRLAAVFLVLTLSIPFLVDSMERTETDMAAAELGDEIGRIADAASIVYFSGSGSSKTVQVDVPAGCEIRVGMESGDPYRITGYRGGVKVAEKCIESPAFPILGGAVLSGECLIVLENVADGFGGRCVEVSSP